MMLANEVTTIIGSKFNTLLSFFTNEMIILTYMLSLAMIGFAVLSSRQFIIEGLKRYDDAANKEWSEKDLDRWCYCSIDMKPHKIKIHENDPKFFIQ
jgi:hypothetical protein